MQSTQTERSRSSSAVASGASETTLTLCTTWGIWYADSGQGEDHLDPGGLGWTSAARAYLIHANRGCGGGMSDDSCYNNQVPPFEVVLGTAAVGGGATQVYWKFLVAHEIGHSIQHRAMGYYEYAYGDGNTTHERCLCEHYDSSWGNSIHCLQSRQSTGGGELEGFAHSLRRACSTRRARRMGRSCTTSLSSTRVPILSIHRSSSMPTTHIDGWKTGVPLRTWASFPRHRSVDRCRALKTNAPARPWSA